MSNNQVLTNDQPRTEPSTEQNESVMFSFDAPEIFNSDADNYQYSDLFYNDSDDYWETPINRSGLNKLSRANAYHGAILMARRNMIAGRYRKGGLTKQQLQANVNDYLEFGDAAILKLRNGFGKVVGLYPLPAMHLRKNNDGDFWLLERDDEKRFYKKEDVIFIKQYDPGQQIYGIPDYLGCVQSALLSSDATNFRRRYYKNGLHMGFIFYATDPNLGKEDEADLKEKMTSSRGVGNFKSMFVNIPNGKEKGIQLIPVGDIATKDEFEKIKSVTAQEVLVGHRFPVELAAIIPNSGTRGDPVKFNYVYNANEVIPACHILMDAVNSDTEIPANLHLEFNLDNKMS